MMLAYQPVRSLSTLNVILNQGLSAASRILSVVDTKKLIKNPENAKEIKVEKANIKLIEDCRSLLNEIGYLYIFDATLREDHQKPDDFFRFTRSGIIYALENSQFEVVEIHSSKSPVEALIYTIDQVIQYDLPKELINEIFFKQLNFFF